MPYKQVRERMELPCRIHLKPDPLGDVSEDGRRNPVHDDAGGGVTLATERFTGMAELGQCEGRKKMEAFTRDPNYTQLIKKKVNRTHMPSF